MWEKNVERESKKKTKILYENFKNDKTWQAQSKYIVCRITEFGLVLIIRKGLKKSKAENLQEWQVMLLSGKTLQRLKYVEDSKSEDLLSSSYTSYTSLSTT